MSYISSFREGNFNEFSDNLSFESWGGEIVMMTNSSTHEKVLLRLSRYLSEFIEDNDLGEIYSSNLKIFLHGELYNKDYRLADISFVSKDNLFKVHENGIYGAPDMIVEVLSAGKNNTLRDIDVKYKLYEKFGVREYWVVDPYEKEVYLYTHDGNNYEEISVSNIFPGLIIEWDRVFK